MRRSLIEREGLTTNEVTKATGLTCRQLNYWSHLGFMEPSVQKSSGPGTQKLYSVGDVMRLRCLRELRSAGWSIQKLRKAINLMRVLAIGEHTDLAQLVQTGPHLLGMFESPEGKRILKDLTSDGQLTLDLILETLNSDARRRLDK